MPPTYRGGNATEANFVYAASGCFKAFHFGTHAGATACRSLTGVVFIHYSRSAGEFPLKSIGFSLSF